MLPLEKFPFLENVVIPRTNYIDELAVDPTSRKQGIGSFLGKAYIEEAAKLNILRIILRTDLRNNAAMNLYLKLGFTDTKILDPEYKNRTYLIKSLKSKDEDDKYKGY